MARYSNPVPQILSDVGDLAPIPGAKLFFFEPGTTTEKDTFSDSGLSTPNTNPVIADANGRYGDIFLDGIYKVVQQDASGTPTGFDGNTIWTRDPVGDTTEGQFQLWLNDNTYSIPDIVTGSDDNFYRSLIDANQGNDPTLTPSAWEQIEFERIYNANVTYALGDRAIGSDGMLYFSLIASNLNNNPVTETTSANWRAADQERSADAGGTVDAITATFIPAVAALKDRLILRVTASGANTVTAPTFAPNGLTAQDIVKFGGQALDPGDISGAGHELVLVYDLSNTRWELLNPAKAIQIVSSELNSFVTTTNVMPRDNSHPQSNEGVEAITVTITPKSSGSKILIMANGFGGVAASFPWVAALFKDAETDAFYASAIEQDSATSAATVPMAMMTVVDAVDTAARTYKLRVGPTNGTLTFNGQSGGNLFSTANSASLIAMEIS